VPNPDGKVVIYRMRRAQRAFDNPALEAAIEAANLLEKPVVVFVGLLARHPHGSLRTYRFMLEGLCDTAGRLSRRRIGFVMRICAGASSEHEFARLCSELRPALIVEDQNPMRRREPARPNSLGAPLWSVDADVIVPCALLGREHYAARTIRPRIREKLAAFLKPVGNRQVRVPFREPRGLEKTAPDLSLLETLALDRLVAPAPGFRGGTSEGLRALGSFIRERLGAYDRARNHPESDGTSRLSPYLHFGQLGPHTIALAVRDADAPLSSRNAFLEQLIVRRELAVNFVRFNRHYRSLDCAEPWALRTLGEHARDPRKYCYTARRLEQAETHDELWNAAQCQMVESGWMHNYMRMYWAKKILEWTGSAREAFDVAVRLNDRYELDGRDPNGYAGIAWAICGKHDRAWGPERPIFGKIRYMSYDSTRRKFDSRSYIKRWSR
jgi:deoxyribodipyrimidine photo-lyase